jgi:hypothetical protein
LDYIFIHIKAKLISALFNRFLRVVSEVPTKFKLFGLMPKFQVPEAVNNFETNEKQKTINKK